MFNKLILVLLSDSSCNRIFLDFYLLYAKLEEDYGLPRHAMNIYSRGTSAVEKHEMYKVSSLTLAFSLLRPLWSFLSLI